MNSKFLLPQTLTDSLHLSPIPQFVRLRLGLRRGGVHVGGRDGPSDGGGGGEEEAHRHHQEQAVADEAEAHAPQVTLRAAESLLALFCYRELRRTWRNVNTNEDLSRDREAQEFVDKFEGALGKGKGRKWYAYKVMMTKVRR